MIARSGGGRLVFVGRSVGSVFDLLSGAYDGTPWANDMQRLALSFRGDVDRLPATTVAHARALLTGPESRGPGCPAAAATVVTGAFVARSATSSTVDLSRSDMCRSHVDTARVGRKIVWSSPAASRTNEEIAIASIRHEVTVARSAEHVWDVLRDVGSVHRRLLPGRVQDVSVDRDVRTLTMPDGHVVQELIVVVDQDARRLAYAVVEGSRPPLRHHHASFQVFPEGAARSR